MRVAPSFSTAFMLLIAALASAGCADSSGSQPSAPYASGSRPLLFELQLQGSLEAPVPPDIMGRQLQAQGHARPHVRLRTAGQVALWASDTNFNYLLGQDATGRNTVTAVDLSANSCYSPIALKVDHSQNVWVGCELTSDSGTNGAVQEYSGAGTLENRYTPQCPSNVKGCTTFSGYGFDSGLDANGNVFASLNLYSIETCGASCSSSLGAGFEWWPKGNPSAAPRLISLGVSCDPICGVGFMDVDASGNLWFSFTGPNGSGGESAGLGEVTSPTKNPQVAIIEPIGTYGFFGGVYASAGGHVLSVIDQKARTISQYHLPLSASGAPFAVLGPTPLNAFGIGDPVSGGFNSTETKFSAGDTGGWFDIGKVSKNAWSTVASDNFYSGIEGAAYTPSDK